jgi:CBS domain containing-hemolysin-like protein
MGPPIRALNAGAEAVLRQFGLHSQEELASARTPEELLSLVRHSAAEGTLPRQTARLVIRSLVFGDTRAAEVMTPRTRMVTIAPDATVSDFLTRSAEAGRSRLPVVGAGGLDEIVGIVELDRAVTVPGPRRDTTLVSAVMVAPLVVPHSLPVDDVVRALQTARLPLAIVADEYGGTAGLLTGEDLIEELVGDILDEFDAAPTQVRRTEHGWELSGLLRPDEVAAATGICLPDHGPYETVGGLVMQRLGRLPLTGDRIEFHEAFVTVIAMDRRRVDRVLLQPRAADREAIDRPTESR